MSEYADKIKNKFEGMRAKSEYAVFYDSVIGLSVVDLKKNILLYTKYLQETLYKLKTMPAIKEAELNLKKAKEPYDKVIKSSKDKIKQLKSFVDESICVEDLENQMIIHAMEVEEQKIKRSNCPNVIDAKHELDMVKGPFNDAKTMLGDKIAYLNILVSEKEGFEPGYRNAE